jgi:hypothetical protein
VIESAAAAIAQSVTCRYLRGNLMNLKTATIIALVFTAIGALLDLVGIFSPYIAYRNGFVLFLVMLKDASLALFFVALYLRQKPTE